MRLPSQLSQAEHQDIRDRWVSGESAAAMDREYNFLAGTVTKLRWRYQWQRNIEGGTPEAAGS